MLVAINEPAFKRAHYRKGTGPVLQPETLLLEGAHDALGIGVALGIIIAGQGLIDAQRRARLDEGQRRRLIAVIAHERQALPSGPIRELLVDCHIHSRHPMLGRALEVSVITHHSLGVPTEPNDDRDPAQALHQHFRHVDAPPLMRPDRLGFAAPWRPLGFQPQRWVTRRRCARISRRIRFFLMDNGSTPCR